MPLNLKWTFWPEFKSDVSLLCIINASFNICAIGKESEENVMLRRMAEVPNYLRWFGGGTHPVFIYKTYTLC